MHVKGVERSSKYTVRAVMLCVKGVERSSKYTVRAVMPCMSKVAKDIQIQCNDCNAMYVEGVYRDSKYTIRTHNIFAYNFLNIQLIFNLKKVLES